MRTAAPSARPPRPAATRVGFVSLGCAKNLVDSEVMLGHLDRAGCAFVRDPAEADVIVVNTCGFIDAAREESVRAILEAAEYKKTGRLRRLVVAGCMVQRYATELKQSLPEVDAFVGLDELDRIVARLGLEAGTTPAQGLARSAAAEAPRGGPPVSAPEAARPAASTAAAALAADGARGPAAGGLRLVGAGREAPAPAHPAAPALASTGPPWGRSRYLYDDASPRLLATPPWSAFLKIAEGCDHACAFCAIPSFRGNFRSRRPDSILREAERLARSGVRELNLIAQDSSHFGRDLGIREGLAGLLEQLNGVAGLRWIRVHYLYPNTIGRRLIETMARLPKVVDYVDIPLQHAHRDTLRRMRRGGSAASHLRLLDAFRSAMPGAAIRSTLIVGFPGETDGEFAALLEFVRRARFHHLGVFAYSHEESTAAFQADDDVPPEVKQERLERVMRLQQRIAAEHNAALVGREVEVLAEGAHPETEHLLVGRMSVQAADVDGQVLLNEGRAEPGEFVRVRLTGTAGYDVVGSILGPA